MHWILIIVSLFLIISGIFIVIKCEEAGGIILSIIGIVLLVIAIGIKTDISQREWISKHSTGKIREMLVEAGKDNNITGTEWFNIMQVYETDCIVEGKEAYSNEK